MKALLAYAMLAITWLGILSCQSNMKDPIAPEVEQPTVVNGRLYFSSKTNYVDWVINFSKKSVEEQNRWAHSSKFTPLFDVANESFNSPEVYKYLLNSDKQMRVGNFVVHINGKTVTTVPYDDQRLLNLLKSDPNSNELLPYRKSAIRQIESLESKVSTETDPNGRQSFTYREIKYFPLGPIGGVGNFRFDFRIEEFCDGQGAATMEYYNRIEYQSPRNGGWYQENYAVVDGSFGTGYWNYRLPNGGVYSGSSQGVSFNRAAGANSGNGAIASVRTMDGSYRDYGYTLPFRVEVTFFMKAQYGGYPSNFWSGTAVFTNEH